MTHPPPLLNAHTHLELTWAGHLCPTPPGQPFHEWIFGLVQQWRVHRTDNAFPQNTIAAIEDGITRLRSAGITHVGDISNTGLSIDPLLASGLHGVVYIEVIGADKADGRQSFARARALLEKERPNARGDMRVGLTPHSPYSLHPDVIEEVAGYCIANEVPLCMHVAESPAELEALRDGTGPLFTLAEKFGVAPPPAPGVSPVQFVNHLGILDARPLLVHMVQVDDDDLDLLASHEVTIAHCPRSNALLRCGRMPLEKMLDRHIPVTLGTDSLGSAPSLNIRDEAAAARAVHEDRVPAGAIDRLLRNVAAL